MATVTFTAAELKAIAAQVPPASPIDLNALAAKVAAILQATTPPVTPPVTPPAAGTFWLYKAGVFKGAGDYDYGSGSVTFGPSSVIVLGDEAWQPRMPADDLNTDLYTAITVSIKPTQNQTWGIGAEMIGDVPIPGTPPGVVDIMKYGPNPAVLGQWNTYRIPLTAIGIKPGSGIHIYKIGFQGQNVPDPKNNRQEFDAVGFVP